MKCGAIRLYNMFPIGRASYVLRPTNGYSAPVEPQVLRRIRDNGLVEAVLVQESDLGAGQIHQREIASLPARRQGEHEAVVDAVKWLQEDGLPFSS